MPAAQADGEAMGNPKRRRVDELLCERELCESREEAAKLVMAGMVRTGPDSVVSKASELLPENVELSVERPSPYVSRGAYKLIDALDRRLPSLTGLICLDVGASTGGFTDLMLQRGASKVYAADVGKGQLHLKLRKDPRVVCLEGVNARGLSETKVPERIDALSADVSFISVTKVLGPCDKLLKPGAWAFILVKPQFESDSWDAPGGVVREESVRKASVEKVRLFAESSLGWSFVEAEPCKIKGPKGNQEYMAVFRKP